MTLYEFITEKYPDIEKTLDFDNFEELSHVIERYAEHKVELALFYNIEEILLNRDKANINLQHDAHNNLDRISDKLYQLDQWKKDKGTFPYILAEYMRTHIKDMRETINQYYYLVKNTHPLD